MGFCSGDARKPGERRLHRKPYQEEAHGSRQGGEIYKNSATATVKMFDAALLCIESITIH